MTMFLAELVFIFELSAFVAGLVLFYQARKEASVLLKFAAVVLIIGSLGTAICTSYYSLKYYRQGGFDSVMPHPGMPFDTMEDGRMHHYYYEGMDIKKKPGDMYHEMPRD